jgi:hypothetical protein
MSVCYFKMSFYSQLPGGPQVDFVVPVYANLEAVAGRP